MAIEGLKIQVTTDELREHVNQRTAFHREKAEWYQSQIEALQTGGLQSDLRMSGDPVQTLKAHQETHRNKRSYFGFLSDHLVPDEVYILTERDLADLEIYSRYL